MSIRFNTTSPNNLLNTFKKAIDDGYVLTWKYDNDNDFTHTTDQWKDKAWLRPEVVKGESLIFSIIKPKNSNISREVYAVYHGRFVESMLAHCDSLFTDSVSSAMPEDEDLVAQ